MRAWVNGKLLDSPEELALSVTDHGVTVGDGVFETLKVVSGVPFARTRHLDRLQFSAHGLALGELDRGLIEAGIDGVLQGTDWPLGRLRVTVTGGPGPAGSARGGGPLTVIVTADEISPQPESTKVITVEWPRNERGATAGLKTTSYADNVVALARAAEHGASEAIFPNTVGDLCEGTGTNIFYVLDGELRTPSLASGCLAGVTRALVLQWVGAHEVDQSIEALRWAEEIFVTSTTRDVQAVVRVDERELSVGAVTRHAQRTWREREALDLDP